MSIVIVMGVSGVGKSSLARALSHRRGAAFIEGDDLHPHENRARMAAGIALTDEDRYPWLVLVGEALRDAAAAGGEAIASCSALRRVYRDRLREAAGQPVLFLHLATGHELIRQRITQRRDHYMPASLLDSQIAALEPPQDDEWSATLAADQPLSQLAEMAERVLQSSRVRF